MQSIAQRILLLSGWRRALTAFLAGALTVLALAPAHLVFICFLTFPVLVWLLDGSVGTTPGRRRGALWAAFRTGWWFGFGYFVAGLWWMSNALLVEAPEFAWAIPLAALGLPAVLAVFYGMACTAARMVWSDGIGRIFALAAAFGVAEWVRSFVLTGLPWNTIGYAIMPVPAMMQSITLVGLFGMSAFAVLIFALPAQLAARSRRSAALAGVLCLLLVVAHLGFGIWRLSAVPAGTLQSADTPTVRLVQPNIAQTQKMDGSNAQQTFETLLALTQLEPMSEGGQSGDELPPGLVIWPETAVPFLLTQEPRALARIGEALAPNQTLLTGAFRRELTDDGQAVTGRFYNSVLAIDSDGVIAGAADKVHLVPFGEYLPLAGLFQRLGLQAIAAADRGYSAAVSQVPVTLPDGTVVFTLICYEAIFPWLAEPATGGEANLIVNVTNDAWFGRTPGPYQHMHMTRLRAVETGVPLIRVANTGISASVDPLGRINAEIGLDERAAADVKLLQSVMTITDYSQRQIYFWLCILVFSSFAFIARSVSGRTGR